LTQAGGNGDFLERKSREFFIGWFNNKMMLILLWIQSPRPRSEASRTKLIFFLDELYHHFMSRSLQGDETRTIQWLKLFLARCPLVAPRHRLNAFKMCARIYRAYGLEFRLAGYARALEKGKERNT
jgi:hypothetical protein